MSMSNTQLESTKDKRNNITNLAIQRRRLKELDALVHCDVPKNRSIEPVLRKLKFYPCGLTEYERFYCDLDMYDPIGMILGFVWRWEFDLVKIVMSPKNGSLLRMEITKPAPEKKTQLHTSTY